MLRMENNTSKFQQLGFISLMENNAKQKQIKFPTL